MKPRSSLQLEDCSPESDQRASGDSYRGSILVSSSSRTLYEVHERSRQQEQLRRDQRLLRSVAVAEGERSPDVSFSRGLR